MSPDELANEIRQPALWQPAVAVCLRDQSLERLQYSRRLQASISLLLLGCLCSSFTACRITPPPVSGVGSAQNTAGGSLPASLGRGLSSSYKPAQVQPAPASGPTVSGTAASGTAAGQPVAQSSAARVRGQSPSGWSDPSRTPLPATDVGGGSNRYAPAAQPVTLPGIPAATAAGTPGPNTVYQPPLPPASSPGYAGGAYAAPGGYGYTAPGATAPPAAYPTAPYGSAPAYGNAPYGPPAGFGASPSDYAIAPGASGPLPGGFESTVAPGAFPGLDPSGVPFPNITAPGGGTGFQPRQRVAPIDVFLQEARTGRIILGGSVNSDLGVAGQLIIDERNFDITRVPHSWDDFWSGRAFRGGGQNFRAEIMPGNQVQRYTVNWTERNLFGYLPYSLSVGGFLFTRQFRDWTEQRLGGRVALGYEVTKDLSVSSELRLEDVNISNPRVGGVSELDAALGSNDIYTARFRVARDTRDSPFLSTEGSLLELIFDQVFGEYDYSRGNINYSRYFLLRERADQRGRHTIASTWKLGITGSQTPIFENYFAGGYSTLRGFSFRGASPTVGDVQVGGELQFLGSLEYVFPLTADEMLRGVAFVDYGTVEPDLKISSEDFRVAPGLGIRVSVPALGPAPLAFDFAYPINHADTDDRQIFSFFMGVTR